MTGRPNFNRRNRIARHDLNRNISPATDTFLDRGRTGAEHFEGVLPPLASGGYMFDGLSTNHCRYICHLRVGIKIASL